MNNSIYILTNKDIDKLAKDMAELIHRYTEHCLKTGEKLIAKIEMESSLNKHFKGYFETKFKDLLL